MGGADTSGRAGASIVPGDAAQALVGRARVAQQTAQGLAQPGDGVRYALEVRVPGRYRSWCEARTLAPAVRCRCNWPAPRWRRSSPPTAISFGVTAIQAGSTTLEITTGTSPPRRQTRHPQRHRGPASLRRKTGQENSFGGININGGRDNLFDNNLFAACEQSITGGYNPQNKVWPRLAAGENRTGLFQDVAQNLIPQRAKRRVPGSCGRH